MLRRPPASRTVQVGPRVSPRVGLRAGLRIALVLLAVGLCALATLGNWQELRSAAGQLAPGAVGLAAAAVLAGLFASMLSWRAVLADLGSVLPVRTAMRVFFLGQLGKYLPGSVWWLVGQVELGVDEGVPRRRTAAAGSVAVLLSLVAGLALAAGILPLLATSAAVRYWPALVALPPLLAALHPGVLNAVLNRILRLAGRQPLEHPLSGRGLRRALGLAAVAWLGYGVQIAVLSADLGASGGRATALAIGGFALAWSVGFLAIVVPAGLGVREAALVAGLAPVLAAGPALLVALLSRVLMSAADLAWAGVAAVRRRSAAGSDRVEPV